jgi:site-specific recombinase XerD
MVSPEPKQRDPLDRRLSVAPMMFEAGLRIEQVAMLTGHKDWRTLKRYTQLKPMDILAAFPAKERIVNIGRDYPKG